MGLIKAIDKYDINGVPNLGGAIFYDANHIPFEGNNTITVKAKNARGLLENKTLNVVEAWMFMTKAQASGKTLLENGQTKTLK